MQKIVLIEALVLLIRIQYAHSEPITMAGIAAGAITAYETYQWAKQKWQDLEAGWEWFSSLTGNSNSEAALSEYNNEAYGIISNDMLDFSRKIDELKAHHDERHENLEKLLLEVDRVRKIRIGSTALNDKLTAVNLEFEELKKILPKSLGEKIPARELCVYANSKLADNKLSLKIDAIFMEVLPDGLFRVDLWSLIRDELMEAADEACGKGHSAYDFLHSFYNKIMLTEMQGYIMLAFLHSFTNDYNGTYGCNYNFDIDAKTAIGKVFDDFEKKLEKYSDFFTEKMKDLRRDFRQCDGQSLERGVTFFELEGLVQVVSALPDSKKVENCQALNGKWYSRDKYCVEYNQCYSLPRPCLGVIESCVEYDNYINFCLEDSYSSRRYQWIHPTGSRDDESSKCSGKFYQTYPKWTFNCLCHCFDSHPTSMSTHVINLQSVEADVDKNMVVTGIRFIVQHRVLNLQIQQGVLIDHWRVKYPEWKPIKDISEDILAHRTGRRVHGELPNLTETEDYLVITGTAGMGLNTMYVPDDHLLTGASFYIPKGSNVVELRILTRPFDHLTGKLNINSQPNIVYGARTSETLFANRKYPLVYSPRTVEVPSGDGRVTFEVSDEDSDFGQTTIPLFDAVPLVSTPPSPLGGIGVILKSTPESASLISLKFFSLDYGSYMKKSVAQLREKVSEEKKKLSMKLETV